MSKPDNAFAIELDDGSTLESGDMIEHVDYGPMYVDSIRVGPVSKTAELKSDLGPEGLDLSGDKIREQWGETMHVDPTELYSGETRFGHEGVTTDGVDIEVTIKTEGKPEKDTELVHMHAYEQIVRALQATRDEVPPEDCDGAEFSIDWERVFEEDEGE